MNRLLYVAAASAAVLAVPGCLNFPKDVDTNPAVSAEKRDVEPWTHDISENAERMLKEGREIFRSDTFGSEAFWGGQLNLPEGTELPVVVPSSDGKRGVCIFTSDSVDTVRKLVDSATGKISKNEFYAINEGNALGLPVEA